MLNEVVDDGPVLGCISPEHIISMLFEDKIVKNQIVR